jgi:hypothetical protein
MGRECVGPASTVRLGWPVGSTFPYFSVRADVFGRVVVVWVGPLEMPSNHGRFGPFASGHGHKRDVVLSLDRLGREQAQWPDAFGELAAWLQFRL